MRMSCNGCRVLRKGCSENCSIRPCLQWIKSPESQANATVFLAKFYGRAGLLNLINTGPQHLRPAIFRSLLYEACGRIVNPIYGSVGLLWSGNWSLCQNAVEAVLKGAPIVPIGSEVAEQHNGPPFKAYDIRHVSKDEHHSAGSNELHHVRTRPRFKKLISKASKSARDSVPIDDESGHDEANWSPSHESSLSHLSEAAVVVEDESVAKVSPLVVRTKPNLADKLLHAAEDGEIELELTLGFEPVHKKSGAGRFCGPAVVDGANKMDLGLDCPARAG